MADTDERWVLYECNGVKFSCGYYPGGDRKLRQYPAGLLFKSVWVPEDVPDTAEALYDYGLQFLAKLELGR